MAVEIQREAGDDVLVSVKFRRSAFDHLAAEGLPVNGTMQLVAEPDGDSYAVVIWSAEMPEWPDPVPGNALAAEEARR